MAQKNLATTLSRIERQELIERKEKELSIVQQAELLEVNRSSLYYRAVPPSQEEVALKHRIDEMYTQPQATRIIFGELTLPM